MRQALHHLRVRASGRGLIDISADVRAFVREQRIDTGLLTLFCRHTSASLVIQENADPSVRRDLERYFETLAPEDPQRYEHDTEGPDDMPAHVKAMLNGVTLHVPVLQGTMKLGTWQGLYLAEHRSAPHRREIVLQFIGSAG